MYDSLESELMSYTANKYIVNFPTRTMLQFFRGEMNRRELPALYPMPGALDSALKRHQVDGVEKALKLGGRILVADEMGAGKTLLAVGVLARLQSYPCLVVCPATVKYVWAETIEKYLFEQIPFDEIISINSSSDSPPEGKSPKIVLMSYQMVVRLESYVCSIPWKCVICDESQFLHTNLSGRDAAYTDIVKRITSKTPFCLLLSGTPISQSIFDLYNQLNILWPGLIGCSRWDFLLQYCDFTINPYLSVGKCVRLREVTSFLQQKCFTRRLKKDVLDIPVKIRLLYPVDSLFCSGQKPEGFQEKYALAWRLKREGIIRAIDNLRTRHKQLVLFAYHRGLIRFLEDKLKQRNLTFIRICGKNSHDERCKLLNQFSKGLITAAIISIKACAVGISLASSACAVFCELPPDAAWMRQAEDRLHRIGQEQFVSIYYVIGNGISFDESHLKKIHKSYNEANVITRGDTLDFDFFPFGVPERHPNSCAKTETIVEQVPSKAQDLVFTISKLTERIHVKATDGKSYWSFSPDEANTVVRTRSLPLWEQLGQFLSQIQKLTSHEMRRVRGVWNASNVALFVERKKESHSRRTGSHQRYAQQTRIGWGIWWKIKGKYGTSFYFCNLKRTNVGFKALCLFCRRELASGSLITATGVVIPKEYDISFFCDGNCRSQFFFQRSSRFIRQCLVSEDDGVCAECRVNCRELYNSLAQCETLDDRRKVVESHHPNLMRFPKLYQRLLINPSPGACWHADHVIPVCMGGGESGKDNVQTLCVVCHTIKTKREQPAYAVKERKIVSKSSTEVALDNISCLGRQDRVTKIKKENQSPNPASATPLL